jgi:ribosomal protein S18 acetylase RimI-like enzyme
MTTRNGLIAEYLFDGSAADSSGRSRHGEIHGAAPATDRFGRAVAAYHFDGRDDYIAISPPPALGETFSVSVWARYDSAPQSGWTNCVVCQDNGDDTDQSHRVFQLSTFGPHLVWHRMCQARDLIFKRRMRAGTWYHIAATVGDGVHRLYVDGRLQDSRSYGTATSEREPMYIGRKGTSEPSFFFKGTIDDVRLYDRALDAGEVEALFHEGGYESIQQAGTGEDRLSGNWGTGGVTFLELTLGHEGSVTGRVMSGRPDNMAPIASGEFDSRTGALTLEGEARPPQGGDLWPYAVEGVLDGDMLTVSYRFGRFDGNETFTQAGAVPQPHPHRKPSAFRDAMKRALIGVSRSWLSLSRPSKAGNTRRLRERGEDAASLVIRDAAADDIPSLAQLHVTTWNATYAGLLMKGPSVAIRESQWRQAFATQDGSWFCLLVENRDGELVGFARVNQRQDGSGELNKIYLLGPYQRLGLGRRLVGEATRRLMSQGVTSMASYVEPRNPSSRFYEALGAEHLREPDGRINYTWYVWRDLPRLASTCRAD